MRHQAAQSITLATVCFFLATAPGLCGYDAFELPAGVEQTPIPRAVRHSATATKTGPTAQDIELIESYRGQIQRCFDTHDYIDADPIYQKYIALLERVGADDPHLASALQHYADLLRKINKTSEAAAAEARAQALFNKTSMHGQAYGLKEYRLGMSLDDFTRLTSPAGVKSVCSCDQGQSFEMVSEADKDAKVIQCGFWKTNAKGEPTGEPYELTVATLKCSPDFRFVETDGIYRLMEISIGFYSSNYEDMKKALVSKYGEPTKTEVEKMHTEMGNIFPLTNLIWDNGVSKIKLTNADGTNLGRARLRYIHRQLFLAYANRVNQQKNNPAKTAADDL